GRSPGVFGIAPRDMARAITLQQTVEMVRITIETVESQTARLAAPGEEPALREALLRYSREIAFAAAQAYAQGAESRGAWDARLEAQVIDTLLRDTDDEALPSRAAALGWTSMTPVAVALGSPPDADPQPVLDAVQRAARHAGFAVLAGVHGDRLMVVLGGAEPAAALHPLLPEFGPGPVVLGPAVPDLGSARRAGPGPPARAPGGAGRPGARRPGRAAELLPERALCGDEEARRELIDSVYRPLHTAGHALVETVTAYVAAGGSLEGTARALFVHPNTVRYRLRRVA